MVDNNITNSGIDSSDSFYKFPLFVRIAVYDNFTSIPRIIDLQHDNINDFINVTTEKIYQISHEQGGKIPYTIIKEIVENLIHAQFSEVVITIINNGNQIMISDQGPGIADKEKAMLPGFTSATREMKRFIRGVGSGLPIVKETIRFSGGSIDIKDNINNGTVVILKINSTNGAENNSPVNNVSNIYNNSIANLEGNIATLKSENLNPKLNNTDLFNKDISTSDEIAAKSSLNLASASPVSNVSNPPISNNSRASDFSKDIAVPEEFRSINLTLRQIKILYLTLELEESGPSLISKELGFSLSTSFRELAYLEKEGLLKTFSAGKKRLTKKGFKYLEYYSNNF
ncbi:MAG: ATP-binding protein [Actinobacteria bacterium]|nr:ATP-binding protein [Cyanobacteriota bacterium]MCL5772414.1 ATP-binding protein [Actinomycetota bacterium]